MPRNSLSPLPDEELSVISNAKFFIRNQAHYAIGKTSRVGQNCGVGNIGGYSDANRVNRPEAALRETRFAVCLLMAGYTPV